MTLPDYAIEAAAKAMCDEESRQMGEPGMHDESCPCGSRDKALYAIAAALEAMKQKGDAREAEVTEEAWGWSADTNQDSQFDGGFPALIIKTEQP